MCVALFYGMYGIIEQPIRCRLPSVRRDKTRIALSLEMCNVSQ